MDAIDDENCVASIEKKRKYNSVKDNIIKVTFQSHQKEILDLAVYMHFQNCGIYQTDSGPDTHLKMIHAAGRKVLAENSEDYNKFHRIMQDLMSPEHGK